MFTGLIETTGAVVSLTPGAGATRLIVAAPRLAGRWRTGDSIAVNGVCLTALPLPYLGSAAGTASAARGADARGADESTGSAPADPLHFAADLAAETVARTTLGTLQPGDIVNLELPTPAGSPLGGHVVQGHVDGTGKLLSLAAVHPEVEETDWRLTIELPPSLLPHVVPQGSITINGISLTVAHLIAPGGDNPHAPGMIEIAIIPHTYRSTNLHTLAPGSPVNIETDVLAKYAARQAAPRHGEEWLTAEYLLANGY
jgi:riboflavin synthase